MSVALVEPPSIVLTKWVKPHTVRSSSPMMVWRPLAGLESPIISDTESERTSTRSVSLPGKSRPYNFEPVKAIIRVFDWLFIVSS